MRRAVGRHIRALRALGMTRGLSVALALVLLVALTLALPPATGMGEAQSQESGSPSDAAEQARALQAEAAAAERRAREARDAAERLTAEQAELSYALAELGPRIIDREAALHAAGRRLGELREEVDAAQARLERTLVALNRLLASAQRAAREPTPSLLIHPDRPVAAARSAILLRRLSRSLKETSDLARADLERIALAAREAQEVEARAREDFNAIRADEADVRALLARKRDAVARASAAAASEAEDAQRLARRARTLEELSAALAAAADRRAREAEAARRAAEVAAAQAEREAQARADMERRRLEEVRRQAEADAAEVDAAEADAAKADAAERARKRAQEREEQQAEAERLAQAEAARAQAEAAREAAEAAEQADRDAPEVAAATDPGTTREAASGTATADVSRDGAQERAAEERAAQEEISRERAAQEIAPERVLSPPPTRRPVRRIRPQPRKEFAKARGEVLRPVAGQLRRPSEMSPATAGAGAHQRPGLYFATAPYARVISPWDGIVRYAGAFPSYGEIVILEPQNGYQILLTGLREVDRDVGERVFAGEPLGRMGGPPPQSSEFLFEISSETSGAEEWLYFEIRRRGDPIDAEPWLRPETGKATGL